MGAVCCKNDDSKVSPENAAAAATSKEDEYVEATICHENEIGENEMKNIVFEAADICTKVLVIKQKGQISAIGTKCSHSGALLSTGALGDGRVRCPWHGACFNIKTGDIEDYPGQDGIPCYQVNIDNGLVKVRAKRSTIESPKKKAIVENHGRDLTDFRTFVIIGGGPSAAICAQNLRPNGFGGRIVMISKEEYLPYDRVKVSKAMDSDVDSILLRDQEFYDEHDIEVLLKTSAISFNVENKEIVTSSGEKMKFDKVYIATGSSPLLLNVPGIKVNNVFTLREMSHAKKIMEKVNENSEVVVVGSSFTGMECAAFLVKKVKKLTVIGRDSVPFRHSFGAEIGEAIMNLFIKQNVAFEWNTEIKECLENENDAIRAVVLADGKQVKADILIVAIGSTLNTEFLQDSGIEINPDGSIDTNEYLETNVSHDVFVGGDIANSPIYMTGKRENIGHYPLAQYHGEIAASNMCGKRKDLKAIPFFWTMLFGKSFRYAGHGKASEIKIFGSLDLNALKFVAYYIDESEKVIAVSSCAHDPIVSQYAELLAQGKILMKSEVEDGSFDWTKRLNSERKI